MNDIIFALSNSYPDARCMLNYNKDYELVIAVMLSAQTTDTAVNKVTSILFERYKSVSELSNAKYEEVYKIIKNLGLAKKKASNVIEIAKILLEKYDGVVPNNRDKLSILPGVGRKTINVILSELFNEDTLAVDTHVSRLAIRLGYAKEGDNPLIIEEKLMKVINCGERKKAHHLLIRHGREICKSQNPKCENCVIKTHCRSFEI